jgi:glyoxylase-like metal-dependent hydrolase (beta-lactamase superfamily II)
MVMFLEKIMTGSMLANCYIIGDEETKETVIIDPSSEPEELLNIVKRNNLEVKYIINTHGHMDHIGANEGIKEATGAKILIHKDDGDMLGSPTKNLAIFWGQTTKSPPADRFLKDGETFALGDLKIRVIHTPGHTPGGICLLTENKLFSGDTLFENSIGRTDLPGGSDKLIIASIKNNLLTLSDEIEVYPGHGDETTIGRERKNNPFLR